MTKTIYRLTLVFLGLGLTYIGETRFNEVISILGSILFWSSILVISFSALNKPILVLKSNRRLNSFVLFFSYLVVHLFVYSIALEKLLTDVYGQLFSISSPFFTLSYTQFYGNALLASVYNLIFNPSLVIGIPPNFYIELSLYAVIMGLIVATLVSSTILRVKNLFGLLKRMRVALLAPLLGVLGGGSCCISLPLLISGVVPEAGVILSVRRFCFAPGIRSLTSHNCNRIVLSF